MIITVTPNPALDKTLYIPNFEAGIINRVTQVRLDPGGKGLNVSKALNNFGADNIAVGIAGGTTGAHILKMASEMGIKTDFVTGETQTRTNVKVVEPISSVTTDINEPGWPVSEDELTQLFDKIEAHAKKDDIVVLAGRLPAGAPNETYREMAALCRRLGARVILDTSGSALKIALENGLFMIKPNIQELEELVGRALYDVSAVHAAACEVIAAGVQKVAVSLGADGIIVVTKNAALYAPGLKVKVNTTVGAGDSVVAAFAFAEQMNLSDEEALKLALAAGCANVMSKGSSPASMDTINELIKKVIIKKI